MFSGSASFKKDAFGRYTWYQRQRERKMKFDISLLSVDGVK